MKKKQKFVYTKPALVDPAPWIIEFLAQHPATPGNTPLFSAHGTFNGRECTQCNRTAESVLDMASDARYAFTSLEVENMTREERCNAVMACGGSLD